MASQAKSYRSSVDVNGRVGLIFRKYANTYGVKNVCSLGMILIDYLKPEQREELILLVAKNSPIEEIQKQFAGFVGK